MSTDDISDLIKSLLQSISPEALADFGAFYEKFRPLRVTPVGKSKYRNTQDCNQLDRAVLDERKARATKRSKPAHAEPGTRPGRKRKAGGRPGQAKELPDSLDMVASFSIAGAKARKHRQKLERFGPAKARGMHLPKKRVPTR